MKTLFVTMIAIVLIAPVMAQAGITNGFAVSPGELLEINLRAGGGIDIEGWDQDSVYIEVSFNRCDPDDFDFDIRKIASGVRIRSDYRHRVNQSNIQVIVNVPKKFDIKLKTIGGSITIHSVEGRIRGNTAGGEIDLRYLKGDIDLSTGGGRIKIRDSELDGEVTTGGGQVLVENVVGDIDASSGGGNVVYRNVETPDRTYPGDLVYIRNAGGALDVDAAPGGADISTGGGDIWIGTAKESVHARTGGGDIKIEAVDGWVKATTGAGDIEVAMVGDPNQGRRDVTLLTGYGDVTLTVPKGLSADVEVELAFTKKKAGRYGIQSDMPLEEDTTSEWDYDQGEPIKYIYGHSVEQGGKHRIKIRTTNGNVVIREGE